MNNKKIISTVFALAIIATSTSGAFGQGFDYSSNNQSFSAAGVTTANSSLIANLMAQIQRLREILANIPGNASTSSNTAGAVTFSNTAGATTTNPVAGASIAALPIPAGSFVNYGTINIHSGFGMGSHGFNVAALQTALAANPNIYPQGLITGFFGPATMQAVTRFQSMFGLPPVGFVGPLTLAKLRLTFDQLGLMQMNNQNNPQLCVAPGHLLVSGWLNLASANSNGIFAGVCAIEVNNSGNPVPFSQNFSNINVSGISLNGASVNWNFNLSNFTSRVICSTSNPVDVNASNNFSFNASGNSTSVNLSGLNANTQYFCVVRATDANGNVFTSNQFNFTTSQLSSDTTAPAISAVTSSNVTASGATITWTTNENSSSRVFCSTSSPVDVNNSNTLVFNADGSFTSHSVNAIGLNANTQYFCIVRSVDAAGNVATSAPIIVTTSQSSSNNTAAPTVSITAPAANANVSGTVTVSASASDDVGVVRVEFYVDGVLKSTDTSSPYSFEWDTLNNNTHPCNGAHSHTLSAKAYDAAGNVGTSANVVVNMDEPAYCDNDSTAPIITAVASGNITSSGATITWTTDENSSSVVLCSTTNPIDVNANNNLSFNTAGSVTSHSVNANNLSANTTYYCVVRSTDAAGNVATSAQFNFTTSQQ